MGIFDIIGPVMVGPSSSHTAGAARIGLFARGLLGVQPERACLGLHGSFSATGEGHGTHLALVAGLLGLSPSDEGIKEALELAVACGLEVIFEDVDLGDVHPNSVHIILTSGELRLELHASSIGGGQILVWGIDGFPAELRGIYPTILFVYPDQPGAVAEVSRVLADAKLNIAAIKAHRRQRGGQALMEVQLDEVPEEQLFVILRALPRFEQVRFVPALEGA